jgi:hypothetical protein
VDKYDNMKDEEYIMKDEYYTMTDEFQGPGSNTMDEHYNMGYEPYNILDKYHHISTRTTTLLLTTLTGEAGNRSMCLLDKISLFYIRSDIIFVCHMYLHSFLDL